jgi:hypothetical protein
MKDLVFVHDILGRYRKPVIDQGGLYLPDIAGASKPLRRFIHLLPDKLSRLVLCRIEVNHIGQQA